MTKSKRWPNNAEWARMDSISLARGGRKLSREGHKTLAGELERIQDVGMLRAVTRAMEALHENEEAFHEIESRLTACKSEEPEE